MFLHKNYINGEWINTDKKVEVVNPATLEVLGTVPDAGEKEAKDAVDAAHQALASWAGLSAYERSEYLTKWSRLIDEKQEELAKIMTLEQGKPTKDAIGELIYGNAYMKWYAEEAKRVYGEIIPASTKDKRIFVKHEPVGVVAAITPWNFPAAMITRKFAPALAAGCTVVLKPSEETPFTALKLAELAEKAGIPKGVINIVTGDAKTIAGVWQKDARVRKLTFTGSTPVGKILMKDAAETMKKVSLELGGQAPLIVSKHADLTKAVDGALQAKFRNGGQACVAANRFFVHEDLFEEFVEKITAKTAELVYGNGLDEGVNVGPLINADAVDKVEKHVKDAVEKGAEVTTGGKRANVGAGHFFEPTVIKGATDDMLCFQEETFGPVIPVSTFKTVDEAIQRANNTPYGLAAYVFTEKMNEAIYLMDRLQFGIVGINDGSTSAAQAPFGGYKESGLGREGGKEGIMEYLEVKYISLGGLE